MPSSPLCGFIAQLVVQTGAMALQRHGFKLRSLDLLSAAQYYDSFHMYMILSNDSFLTGTFEATNNQLPLSEAS